MNRIAVVSMVKNEIDIIESFLRHTCQFADKLFICDHKSTDGTREIIETLAKELPIEFSTFERDEKDQSGVTTNLMRHAFENKFDLVIPLDADEFLMISQGNSKNLREHLQSLDLANVYQTFLWDYKFVEPEKNQNQFTLSRPAMKAKIISQDPKIFVGRIFFEQHRDCEIIQGNHDLKKPYDKATLHYSIDEKIFYAHYQYRSKEQIISKRMMNWLANSLKAGRYGFFGQLNRTFLIEYFKQPELVNVGLDTSNFIPADDLEFYKDECNLDKNGGGMKNIDPLRNIFFFAENLINTLQTERILHRHEICRVFIFDDGNHDRFEKSLESVKNQTYPYIKIFALEPKNYAELEKILHTSDGSFVQFLIAGDQMHSERIFHCVEAMNSNWAPDILFADVEDFDDMENLPTEFEIPQEMVDYFGSFQKVLAAHSAVILYELIQKQTFMSSGISRGFFRQSIFENAKWIRNWLENSTDPRYNFESSSAIFFTNVMLNQTVHFLREKLIIRGCQKWTRNDFDRYIELCNLIIEQVKG